MNRNFVFKHALIWTLVALLVPCGAFAQPPGPAGGAAFSPQELDQMCAPIALYPDSLLAQVLIAATYPDQVMDADRWLRANPGLRGDALNNALDGMNWDLSVKALAPFPQVLALLAEKPEWTDRLGQAFLAQQADVMDSIQKLRAKAQAAGNLRTTPEQQVVVKDNAIEIVPANPEVVYIPRYDPAVVYGSWWWPAYPPFVYAPVFPGVVVGAVGAFGFWGSVAVGPVWGWGWGSWGWGSHDVNINVNRNININRTTNVSAVRSGMRTTSFHRGVEAGHFGSSKTRAAAFSRTGATGSTAGKSTRPSASSVQQGLKGSATGGSAGKFGSGTRGTQGKFGTGTSGTQGKSSTSTGGTQGKFGTGTSGTQGKFNTSTGGTKGKMGTTSGTSGSKFNAGSTGSRNKSGSGSTQFKPSGGGGFKGKPAGGGGGFKAKPAGGGGFKAKPAGGGGGGGGGKKHK